MGVEEMLLAGWLATPVIAFVVGRFAVRRVAHSTRARPSITSEQRLEELRRRAASGQRVTRGRMADALRMAEDAYLPTSSPGPTEAPPAR